MRLAKYLSQAGVASRRAAEDIITSGHVIVNGETVLDPARDVTDADEVTVDDRKISIEEKVYYLLNKPVGVTSTTADLHADKLITELVPSKPTVWPVGRLDRETSGLIILTNDGDLTQKMTHPSFEKVKEYEMIVDRPLSVTEQEKLNKGIELDDGHFKPDSFREMSPGKYRIIIHEGRNRLLRRAVSYFGKEIMTLTRVRIADIALTGLKPGKYRPLTENELERLLSA